MSKPIERKLRVEICPYLVTARHLGEWTPYRVYTAYSYFGEAFVLLAGFGLSNPVITFLTGGQAPGVKSNPPPATESSIIEFLSSSNLAWVSVGLLMVWGLVKFYVRHEDLEKKCNLLISYRRQCSQLEFKLRQALANENPMPHLVELQTKLSDLVDRNIAEGSIPNFGIDGALSEQTKEYVDNLVRDFSGHWAAVPEQERLQ